MIIIRILGLFYLVLRLWLTEKRLKEFLDYQRHFMSRTLNIFLSIVLITDFEASIFSFIVLTVLPVMILSLITADIRFFIRYHKGYFNHHNFKKYDGFWFLLERITLHIPLVFTGIWMWATGVHFYFDKRSFIEVVVVGSVLMYSAWFLLDRRAYDPKYLPNFRNLMTVLVTISLSITINQVWKVLI